MIEEEIVPGRRKQYADEMFYAMFTMDKKKILLSELQSMKKIFWVLVILIVVMVGSLFLHAVSRSEYIARAYIQDDIKDLTLCLTDYMESNGFFPNNIDACSNIKSDRYVIENLNEALVINFDFKSIDGDTGYSKAVIGSLKINTLIIESDNVVVCSNLSMDSNFVPKQCHEQGQ